MSRPRTILHTSAEVTRFDVNTPQYNQFPRRPLMEIKTPEGVEYHFENPLQVYMKLFDEQGNQIPPNSYLIFGKQSTDDDLPRYFGSKVPYSPYFDLDESQQRDVRFIDSVTHEFGRGINVVKNPEGHIFLVEIESPVAVNLADARTRFELKTKEIN